MNFDFSDEQHYLKSEARRFLDAACPATVVRTVLDGADAFHPALWRSLADQGWLGICIPERYGGLGLGYVELCAIAEELGRVLAPVPFGSTVYCLTEALLIAGSEEQKDRLLPRIAKGDVIGALASAEGPGAVGKGHLAAQVRDGRLSGTKLPVVDGDIADTAVVLAGEHGSPGLFLVDLHGPGVTRDPLQTLDPTRSAARLIFDGAPVERLGAPGDGQALLDRLWDRAAVLFAFEQTGGADRCLEMATAYARDRHAFGRAIGSFQAIKHKLADMYVKNELARSSCYFGAWALAADAAELPAAGAAARLSASEAFWFAAKENIQTHGGIGFTWEVDCHLYYRRSRQLGLVIGAPCVWKERLVRTLERANAMAGRTDGLQ